MSKKLKYFDRLFSSGDQLKRGVSVKWAKDHNKRIRTVDDYFKLLLEMIGSPNLTPRQFQQFKNELWKGVRWSPYVLKVGQVVKLYNKRFTGNLYVITQLDPLGFNVYNRRLRQYQFNNLDYSSIEKIIIF